MGARRIRMGGLGRSSFGKKILSLAEQLDHERLRQCELLDSLALSEGLKAFAEKRLPDFHKK